MEDNWWLDSRLDSLGKVGEHGERTGRLRAEREGRVQCLDCAQTLEWWLQGVPCILRPPQVTEPYHGAQFRWGGESHKRHGKGSSGLAIFKASKNPKASLELSLQPVAPVKGGRLCCGPRIATREDSSLASE